MSSELRAVSNASGPVFGVDAALAELSALLIGHPELYPEGHSERYFRKCLAGDKPMTLSQFQRACDKVIRRYGEAGREMVRRVLDQWISRYCFHTADGEGVSASQKSIDQELIEMQLAGARFRIDVEEAKATGDPRARRNAKRAGDRYVKEIRDVQQAVSV